MENERGTVGLGCTEEKTGNDFYPPEKEEFMSKLFGKIRKYKVFKIIALFLSILCVLFWWECPLMVIFLACVTIQLVFQLYEVCTNTMIWTLSICGISVLLSLMNWDLHLGELVLEILLKIFK